MREWRLAGLILVVFCAAGTLCARQDLSAKEDVKAAQEEPSPNWSSGPVRFILTAKEQRAYRKLGSDEERARAINAFWARRDPDQTTPRNEYREDFYQRVEEATRLFGRWTDDRGKLLLVAGYPTERHSRAANEAWWYEIKSDEIKKELREVKGRPEGSKEKFRWGATFKPNRHGIWEQRSGHDLISAFWKLDPAVAAKLSMAQTEKASSPTGP